MGLNAIDTIKPIGIAGILLAAFALVGTALLTGISEVTKPQRLANERQALLDNLGQVLPANAYTNDLLDQAMRFDQGLALLNQDDHATIYRAYFQDQPVAAVFTTVAPDGYSGDITLLMGVYDNGQISAVRVLQHNETPGLGDKIELAKSDWITQFNGRSLTDPAPNQWTVTKDGGQFDTFTGATITPRAVVRAIYRGLQFFDQYQTAMLQPAATNAVPLLEGTPDITPLLDPTDAVINDLIPTNDVPE